MKGNPGKTIRTGIGNEAAVPAIDYRLCSACGLCVRACKSFTIVERDGKPMVLPDNGLGCAGCAQCACVCPKGAVTVTGRGISAEDLFRLPSKGTRAASEALESLLVSRRSVREYADREVERTTVDRVLSLSSSAPMGLPPSDVGVTVVRGRDCVQELAGDVVGVFGKWQTFFHPLVMTIARPFMKRASYEGFRDFVIPVIRIIIDARKQGIDYLFYHAPCLLVFHQSPYADPADGHVACTYAMVAAASLGLGTCMIGTVSFALQRDKGLKRKWGIPVENTVSLAMIMGYAAFAYSKGIRRRFAATRYVERTTPRP
jgi:ferredoxin